MTINKEKEFTEILFSLANSDQSGPEGLENIIKKIIEESKTIKKGQSEPTTKKQSKPLTKAEAEKWVVERRNHDQDTLLHVAASNSKYDMVCALVNMGIDVNAMNEAGKTAIDCVPNKTDSDKKIKALLSTRTEWLRLLPGMNLNKLFYMLQLAEDYIEKTRDGEKVLYIGPTGVGKTVYLNERLRTKYEYKKSLTGKPEAVELEQSESAGVKPSKQKFETGVGRLSTTLYPNIAKREGNFFFDCDLPGFKDDRGAEERVIAASTIQWLTRLKGGIKGIVVFIDCPTISSENYSSLKIMSSLLYSIFQKEKDLLDSVVYVMNKCEPSLLDKLKNYHDILLQELKDLKDEIVQSSCLDPIKKAYLFMIEHMIENPDRVFLYDLTRKTGDKIDEKLSKLTAVDGERLNFMSAGEQKDFYNFLIHMKKHRLNIDKLIKTIDDEINTKKNLEKTLTQEIIDSQTKLREKKEALSNLVDNPDTVLEIERCIREMKQLEDKINNIGWSTEAKVCTAFMAVAHPVAIGLIAQEAEEEKETKKREMQKEKEILLNKIAKLSENKGREKGEKESELNNQIKETENEIASKEHKKKSLHEEIENHEVEKRYEELKLEVNRSLFDNIKKIMVDLGLESSYEDDSKDALQQTDNQAKEISSNKTTLFSTSQNQTKENSSKTAGACIKGG